MSKIEYSPALLKKIDRIWHANPTLSFGELMGEIGNRAGMSIDNMSIEQIRDALNEMSKSDD